VRSGRLGGRELTGAGCPGLLAGGRGGVVLDVQAARASAAASATAARLVTLAAGRSTTPGEMAQQR
jgi:hypothetical protein